MAESLETIAKSQGKSAKEILELIKLGKMKLVSSDSEISNSGNQNLSETNGSGAKPEFPPRDTATEPEPINEEMKDLIKEKLIELK